MVRTQIQLTEQQAMSVQRARAAAGRFHSGMKDVSARHDAHLAEAFKTQRGRWREFRGHAAVGTSGCLHL